MKSKKIISDLGLCIVISITILIIGCSDQTSDSSDGINSQLDLTKYKQTKSILTGNILDKPTKNIYNLKSKFGNDKISIDSNNFKTTLNHTFPMIVDLSIAYNVNYPIFISPGDSIHIKYNEIDLLNNFTRISFSGNHSKENNLLLELKGILKYDNTNYNNFFNCSEEIFLHKIDSIERIANESLKRYKEKETIQFKDFEVLAQSYIDFKIANYLGNFPQKNKNSYIKGSLKLSEKYTNKMKSYKVNYSNHLNNISFANYASGVTYRNALKMFQDEGYNKKGRLRVDLNTYFNSIDSIFDIKEIIDYLKYNALIQEIYLVRNKPEPFFEQYKNSKPHSSYLKKLKNALSETSKITKDYSFKDVHGKNRFFSEFKGKIVYIDIWATWCFPCLQERKYFEELIDRFKTKNNDIVFVGISIDTDIMKWKDMVEYKKMTGIQLISPQGFKSELCEDFGIHGIPRFMILNRKGEITEPNAIKPSNNEIYTYLNKISEEIK